ncbi:MAG TPA: hypothetical protein DDX39_02555 [Bacteroidales bacterium]|nr:MAG: hypothetical protein A2W98_03570 [Bacteroidetes bacterium GWF2_33_38]OFY68192.1 MAG: hypothetical protein A2265_01320 [Bacteroidetes bacterium RIFOXYA12_FULL_33_9]HBF87497.1 hypothetical protein [Bacteroidales bacterium]
MILKFRITSNEVKNFFRDIQVKSSNTFFDLHDAIQSEVEFDKAQLASFFLTDETWQKGREITLLYLGKGSNSPLIMDETIIGDYFNELNQKLMYVFDFFSSRFFAIELIEITNELDRRKKYPFCSDGKGDGPQQIVFEKKRETKQVIFEEEIIDELDLAEDDDDGEDKTEHEEGEEFGIDPEFLENADNFDDGGTEQ